MSAYEYLYITSQGNECLNEGIEGNVWNRIFNFVVLFGLVRR